MPTVRRRQRLSSSCTAPAERSPAISMRAMSLRISTGRSNCGFGLAFRGFECERRFAERQALEVERAHRAGLRAAGGGAQHLHAERAGGVVGARRARAAPAMPPATIVIGRVAERCARLAAKSRRRRRDRPRRTATPVRRRWWRRGTARSPAAPRRGRRCAASA